ncbi:tetratricopeptide repeat protein [Tepidibacillus sp. HK-1]|uniref:tetratricopeptide repeat protein n=1 Tax=Tepidibacillus sp. HK-1 TaxID=1883407 RepID=UPI00085357D9|nr:tetratricopeptide repeat protein [Tepidibacillus sp. HK-1]GBF12376.1 transcriptional activator NprA [Tepidibacillus sp. HK-1]
MKIGDKIRYYRIKKGLTQSQLAEGICSKSYLSKIENNLEVPHKEVVGFIFERLGLSSMEEDLESIETIKNKLQEWYEVIISREKDMAIEMEKAIRKEVKKIEEPTILIDYQLFSLRYQLLLRNLHEAENIIDELKIVENGFSEQQTYYFYTFYGLYKYMKNDLLESLEYYSKAEKISQDIHITEPELNYLLSLVHSRLYHITFAIHYANSSLELFNHNMDYMRSIETQSILSINYIRLHEYEKAEHYLNNSLKTAIKLNDPYLLSNIYHNLGYLFSKMNRHEQAIDYYIKSCKLKKGQYDRITNTIFYMVESYLAINSFGKAKEWLEKGIKIAEDISLSSIKQNCIF